MYSYYDFMIERLCRVPDEEKEEVVKIAMGAFCTEKYECKRSIERDKRILENLLLFDSDDSKKQVDIVTERIKKYTRRLEVIEKYL